MKAFYMCGFLVLTTSCRSKKLNIQINAKSDVSIIRFHLLISVDLANV